MRNKQGTMYCVSCKANVLNANDTLSLQSQPQQQQQQKQAKEEEKILLKPIITENNNNSAGIFILYIF